MNIFSVGALLIVCFAFSEFCDGQLVSSGSRRHAELSEEEESGSGEVDSVNIIIEENESDFSDTGFHDDEDINEEENENKVVKSLGGQTLTYVVVPVLAALVIIIFVVATVVVILIKRKQRKMRKDESTCNSYEQPLYKDISYCINKTNQIQNDDVEKQ